jgi:hypothetical protein
MPNWVLKKIKIQPTLVVEKISKKGQEEFKAWQDSSHIP